MKLFSTLLVLFGRFVTGMPMNGERRTNATFLLPATMILHNRQVRKWSWYAGWKRSIIRIGMTVGIITSCYAHLTGHDYQLRIIGAIALFCAIVVGCFRSIHAFKATNHLDIVAGLHNALTDLFDMPPLVKAKDYIDIPSTYNTDDKTPGTIMLPSSFNGTVSKKEELTSIIYARLNTSDIETQLTWKLAGSTPFLLLKRAPQPPTLVPLSEWLPHIKTLKHGEVMHGVDANEKVYTTSFADDDPHWAASVGSRRGKSMWLTISIAQILAQDMFARVVFIDPKRVSAAALVGVPFVKIYNNPRDIASMWNGIRDARIEMDVRADALEKDPTIAFPKLLVVVDEGNQYAAMSAGYWKKIKKPSDDNTAPMWEDLSAIAWQGAQLGVHLIYVGQRLDSKATGGFGLRDSFGLRAIAGVRENQWRMLIGGPMPKHMPKERGRWIYSDGTSERIVQNLYATPQEIRDLALSAIRVETIESVPVVSHLIVGLENGAIECGMSYDGFRKMRSRAPYHGSLPNETKIGNQPAWPVETLQTLRKVST